MFKLYLCFLHASLLGAAFTFPFPGALEIDCRNKVVVEALTRYNVNFRCIGNKQDLTETFDSSTFLENDLNNEVADYSDCSDPLRNCIDTSVAKHQICLDGYKYDRLLKKCLPSLPHEKISSSEKKFSSYTLCDPGFYYDRYKSECVQENLKSKSAALKATNVNDCPEGYIYNSEIDYCLKRNQPKTVKKLPKLCDSGYYYDRYEDQCIQESLKPPAAVKPINVNSCPEGYFYNSEISYCVRRNKPKVKVEELPKALAQISLKEHIRISKCGVDMVYNPSIDMCLPHIREKPQNDAAMSHQAMILLTTPDPFRLRLRPLTHEQIGWNKCKSNEVYVSEIDLCMEMPERP